MKKSTKIIICILIIFVVVGLVIVLLAQGPANSDGGKNKQTSTDKNSGNTPPIIEQHSIMLQNILNDEYYDGLIARVFKNDELDLLDTALFQAHPYAFLEDQGINVEEIKNGQTQAYTMSYVLDDEPNNLYIYTRVLQDDYYYSVYLLKYRLTDKEMDEYHLLHSGQGQARFYIQSVFLNNEISEMKTPEIVGSSKIKKKAYEEMRGTAKNNKFVQTNNCDVIFLNPNKEEKTFSVIVIPNFGNDRLMTFEGEIANLTCKSFASLNFDNDIFTAPYRFGGSFSIPSNEKETATFYFPQDTYLNVSGCRDFEKENWDQ